MLHRERHYTIILQQEQGDNRYIWTFIYVITPDQEYGWSCNLGTDCLTLKCVGVYVLPPEPENVHDKKKNQNISFLDTVIFCQFFPKFLIENGIFQFISSYFYNIWQQKIYFQKKNSLVLVVTLNNNLRSSNLMSEVLLNLFQHSPWTW